MPSKIDFNDVDAEFESQVKLNLISGIGPRLTQVLLSRFETAENIFAASGQELLQVPGIGGKLSAEITMMKNSPLALKEIEACRKEGIDIITITGDRYPSILKEIPDPPTLLYSKGDIKPHDQIAISIVGSRHCSYYGLKMAEQIAYGLAIRGVTIVSGLARGIDSAAHRGALKAGGRTLAVLATGLNNLYPPENKGLAEEIIHHGALLTEAPLNRPTRPGCFPQRNRIISGLSVGVIVIEATQTSGSLHTARHAQEQGREIFALPGQVDRRESEGCHALLRDGATLIRGAHDVLEELGPLMEPVKNAKNQTINSPRELNLSEQEMAILNMCNSTPKAIDEIVSLSKIEISRVLATLTILEMKQFIQRLPGGEIVRKDTIT